jgi:adenosylcobinamide-phosphate synthase
MVGALILSFMISPKSLAKAGKGIYALLLLGNLEEARQKVGWIVGRDTDKLSEAEIARATVETIAENTVDGIIAPLFFFAIGGVPLAVLYRAANTMDSMIGYRNEKYLYFGRTAARLDDVLNFLPARLSGVLMVLMSRPLGFDAGNAWKIFLRDRKKHASPNSAQTEAACAGALHIRLAGDAVYFGEVHHKPYIGDDDRPVQAQDIAFAVKLMYGAAFAALAICLLIRLAVSAGGGLF